MFLSSIRVFLGKFYALPVFLSLWLNYSKIWFYSRVRLRHPRHPKIVFLGLDIEGQTILLRMMKDEGIDRSVNQIRPLNRQAISPSSTQAFYWRLIRQALWRALNWQARERLVRHAFDREVLVLYGQAIDRDRKELDRNRQELDRRQASYDRQRAEHDRDRAALDRQRAAFDPDGQAFGGGWAALYPHQQEQDLCSYWQALYPYRQDEGGKAADCERHALEHYQHVLEHYQQALDLERPVDCVWQVVDHSQLALEFCQEAFHLYQKALDQRELDLQALDLQALDRQAFYQELGEYLPAQRTHSCNPEELSIGKIKFKAFEFDNYQSARRAWRDHYVKVDAVVYLVDVADTHTYTMSFCQLVALLFDESLANVPLLILANTYDEHQGGRESDLTELIYICQKITCMNRPAKVFSCSIDRGMGYKEGFNWLYQSMLQ